MKKVNWKVVFKIFAWIVSLAGITALMSFVNIKRQQTKCIKVQILIPGADNFVEREEIESILRQSNGELVGRRLEEINIQFIEDAIKRNPYIAFVKVFTDMDGVISIEINQREPVLRVINAKGQDFYVDSKGLKMPISPNFTANVLVSTGNILEKFNGKADTLHTPLGKDLYKIALFAKKDSLWDALFEQMYVNDKTDIELAPRVGNHRIILGNADSLDKKLSNLMAFYKQGIPLVGWNAYKTINLKYCNQVVCERNVPTEFNKIDSVKKTADTAIKEIIKAEISDIINRQSAPASKTTAAGVLKSNNTETDKAVAAAKTTLNANQKKSEAESVIVGKQTTKAELKNQRK